MRDPRLKRLAQNLVQYSINVQQGENILIEMIGEETELVKCLIEEVAARGGRPFVELSNRSVLRTLLQHATEEQITLWAELDLARMKKMDGYIGVRAGNNVNELQDVPAEKMKWYEQIHRTKVHMEQRVKKTKWVILRYPNASMAQLAQMSTESFEDFYFNVCNLDYAKMEQAMEPLFERMKTTDQVRIVSPGTDLSFSIKGIGAKKCSGHRNIPDGEVFSAPVRDSVHGTIHYNTPTVYSGTTFQNIKLTFEDGKIVGAEAGDQTDKLNQILDTDEDARYIGEFAIGFNPYILNPMNDILFDEKIAGSLHFTPGQCYEECNNGNNNSSIHWDLVLIQRPEYGGGEIYFDGELIRKDGQFVVDDLLALNAEHLIS